MVRQDDGVHAIGVLSHRRLCARHCRVRKSLSLCNEISVPSGDLKPTAVLYSSSVRALILYCVKYPERKDRTLFFLEQSIPEKIRTTFWHVALPTPPYERRLAYYAYMLCTRWRIGSILSRLRGNDKELQVFGTDNQIYSPLFYKTGRFVALEEGAGNYVESANFLSDFEGSNFLAYARDLLLYGCRRRVFGRSPYVGRIILTRPAATPSHVRAEVEGFDLIEALARAESRIVLEEHFGLGILDDFFALTTGRVAVVFTQPLVEDGVLTKDVETEFYRRVLLALGGARLIVKAHPRQTTIPGILRNFPRIPSYVPAELLYLYENRIDAVASYHSFALDVFRDSRSIRVIDCSILETPN